MDRVNDRDPQNLSLNRALNKLLESEEFSASEDSRRLLRFLIQASLEGRAASINQQTIGVEVFGRRHGYDIEADPVAARELDELRTRLKLYRLAHPEEDVKLDFSDNFSVPGPKPRTRRVRKAKRPLLSKRELYSALVFLFVAGLIAYSLFKRGDAAAATRSRFANMPGMAASMSLFPDKRAALLAVRTIGGTGPALHSISVTGNDTPQSADYEDTTWYPVHSPNSKLLAFLKWNDGDRFDLVLKNLDTQTQAVVAEAVSPAPTGWSPDSETIYFAQSASKGAPASIQRIEVGSGMKRRVTSPVSQGCGDGEPIVSPDGKQVAFRRCLYTGNEIWLIRAEGKDLRQAANRFTHFGGHAWSSDGRAIYAAIRKFGRDGIWRIPVEKGQAELIASDIANPALPQLISDGKLLVADENSRDSMLEWKINTTPLRPRLVSPPSDTFTATSPDGKKVAWLQDTASGTNLVLSSFDSRPPRFIPLMEAAAPDSLAWFPDASHVVVSTLRKEHGVLQAISVQDGLARDLSQDGSDAWYPAFSANGNTFCYTSTRSGAMEIWCSAWPEAPGRAAQQVTSGGGVLAVPSPNGEAIYFVRPQNPGLMRQTITGGAPRTVLPNLTPDLFGAFAVDEKYLYVGCGKFHSGACLIQSYDLQSLQLQNPISLGNATLRAGRSLALNPDSKTITLAAVEYRSVKLHILPVD